MKIIQNNLKASLQFVSQLHSLLLAHNPSTQFPPFFVHCQHLSPPIFPSYPPQVTVPSPFSLNEEFLPIPTATVPLLANLQTASFWNQVEQTKTNKSLRLSWRFLCLHTHCYGEKFSDISVEKYKESSSLRSPPFHPSPGHRLLVWCLGSGLRFECIQVFSWRCTASLQCIFF